MLKLGKCCDFFWDHPYDRHRGKQDLHRSTTMLQLASARHLLMQDAALDKWTRSQDHKNLSAEGGTEMLKE